jgi:hypothetical protein
MTVDLLQLTTAVCWLLFVSWMAYCWRWDARRQTEKGA